MTPTELPIGERPGASWLLAYPWVVSVLCWPATLLGWYYLTLVVAPSEWRDRFLLHYLVTLLVIDSAICAVGFARITTDIRRLLRAKGPLDPTAVDRAWVEAINLPVRTGFLICGLIALTALPVAVYLGWQGERSLVLHGLVAAAIVGACELTLLYPVLQAMTMPFLRHLRRARPALRLDVPRAISPPLRAYFAFGLGSLALVSVVLSAALIHSRAVARGSSAADLAAILLAAVCLSSMAGGVVIQVWQAVLLPTRRLAEAMLAFSAETSSTGDASEAPESLDRSRRARLEFLSTGDVGLLCEEFDDLVDALTHSRARLEGREALLRHSQRFETMGMMAASLVHEVSNPLNTLMGNLYITSDIVARPGPTGQVVLDPLMLAEVKDALADASYAASQMDTLLRDMRAFGRKESGELQDVSLADTLDGAIRLAGGQLARVKPVERQYAPCPRVQGSPQKLTQVFLNLLLNAVQAIPEESFGRIRVSVAQVGDTVEACVHDNGGGIPADVQARIFEPLFTTKPVGQGTGLGLHLSRQIIVEHGGQLEFESGPAEGTVFRVRIPISGATSTG